MIRVGLIGFGLAGQTFHAPTIRAVPGLELRCILARHGDLARQKYPDVHVVGSVEELLADEKIRLCVVATPNATHYELARKCLAADRDVVIDKPFALTSEDSLGLIRLADERKHLLSAYHNRRWDGDFLTVRKILAAGVLGRIVSYESHFDRFRPEPDPAAWRERSEPGSGTLYNLGPHLLDQAFVLFGAPSAITAHVYSERKGAAVDDAFDIRLEYPGLHALLRASTVACFPGPRFVIHGTRGSFIKNGLDPQEERLHRGELPSGADWGEEPEAAWGTMYLSDGTKTTAEQIKTEPGDYRCFYANVRDAILEGKPLAVTARDGLRTIRAIEKALESSREGRTIPWSESKSASE
jgi:scyllo-inositol 2-dehydrogenase (NADP+)